MSCRHFSLNDFVVYLTTTHSYDDRVSLREVTLCTLRDVLANVWSLLASVVMLLSYMFIGTVRLGTAAMPYLISMTKIVVNFHKTQLTWLDLIVEGAVIITSSLLVFYHAPIVRYIQKLEKSLAKNSKIATRKALRVAPHAIFFALALVIAILGRKFLAPLSSPIVLPLFSLVIPILTTAYTCLREPVARLPSDNTMSMEELETACAKGRRAVLLWVVLAFYHANATLLALIPYSAYLLEHYFPFLPVMALVVMAWSQLSPLFIEIVFEATSPLVRKLSKLIPSSTAEEERSGVILAAMKAFGIIGSGLEDFFKALLVEGTSALIIFVFCFFPTRIATLGTITISLLLPAIRASSTISAWDTKSAEEEDDDTASGRGRDMMRTVLSSSMMSNLRHSLSPFRSSPDRLSGRASFDEAEASSDGLATLGSFNSLSSSHSDDSKKDGEESTPSTPNRKCTFTVGVFTTGRKVKKSDRAAHYLLLKQRRWLEYFVCLGILWSLRCYGAPLWPSVTMVTCWYLSHSLWKGAHFLSQHLVQLIHMLPVLMTPVFLFRISRHGYHFMRTKYPALNMPTTPALIARMTGKTPPKADDASPMSGVGSKGSQGTPLCEGEVQTKTPGHPLLRMQNESTPVVGDAVESTSSVRLRRNNKSTEGSEPNMLSSQISGEQLTRRSRHSNKKAN